MYQLNTEDGNAVYQWFCWIYDNFMERLLEDKEKGKLDAIIHGELRKGR